MAVTVAQVMREKGYAVSPEALMAHYNVLCIECDRSGIVSLPSDWVHRVVSCVFCQRRFTVAGRVWIQIDPKGV